MRSKLLVLEQALTVLVRDHHQRLLAPPFAHIDFLDEQLDTLSADITCLRTDLSILPPWCRQLLWLGEPMRGQPSRASAPRSFHDLCACGHHSRHHSRRRSPSWGTVGGRAGD